MKKGVFLAACVIFAIILLTFSACGGKKDTTVKPKPANVTGTSIPITDRNLSKGPLTKIDLVVLDAYFSPIYPSPGEEVKLKFVVKNQGTENAPPFDYQIKIYKDGLVWKDEKLSYNSSLGKGNLTKISKMYTLPGLGKYYAEIYVDLNDKIIELVESNNNMKTKADATVIDKAAINAASSSSSDDNETEEE